MFSIQMRPCPYILARCQKAGLGLCAASRFGAWLEIVGVASTARSLAHSSASASLVPFVTSIPGRKVSWG